MIIFGLDQKFELAVSGKIFDVTTIEQKLLGSNTNTSGGVNNSINNFVPSAPSSSQPSATASEKVPDQADRIKAKSLLYPVAPEIADPSGFINTPNGAPITISQFKGNKVVLVDFWTYSCINCQRTIPYLNAWYQKYANEGLGIISIHTPEFAFEKVLSNVQAAVKSLGIQYPVVLDNDYGTWNAFGNEYWPRDYLIDTDGFIVYDHAGEGDYDVAEQAIQKALAERAAILGINTQVSTGQVVPTDAVNMNPNLVGSPETYFGSNRNEYLANGSQSQVGTQNLVLPDSFDLNSLYLSGTWNFNPEYAETSDTNAKIVYKYSAKDLYFVAASKDAQTGATVKIILDGKPLTAEGGADVNADGTATIKENRLYKIVAGTDYGEHTIEIDVTKGTLDAYTFTFG